MESLLPPFHFWMSAYLGVVLPKQLWLLAVPLWAVFALGVSPPASPTRPSVAALQFPKHLWKLPCCWWNFSLHPIPSANSPREKISKRCQLPNFGRHALRRFDWFWLAIKLAMETGNQNSELVTHAPLLQHRLVQCSLVFTDNLRPSPSAPSALGAAPQVTEQWPLTSPMQPANATKGFCYALEINPNFLTKTPTFRHPASTSPLDASLALRAAFKSSSSLSKDSFVSCGRRFVEAFPNRQNLSCSGRWLDGTLPGVVPPKRSWSLPGPAFEPFQFRNKTKKIAVFWRKKPQNVCNNLQKYQKKAIISMGKFRANYIQLKPFHQQLHTFFVLFYDEFQGEIQPNSRLGPPQLLPCAVSRIVSAPALPACCSPHLWCPAGRFQESPNGWVH